MRAVLMLLVLLLPLRAHAAPSVRDLRAHDPRRGEALLGWATAAAFAAHLLGRRSGARHSRV